MTERIHRFHAVAFVENLSLKDAAPAFAMPKLSAYELHAQLAGGDVFAYPFGALVFRDVDEPTRHDQLQKLHDVAPGLTRKVVEEAFTVREGPTPEIGIVDGMFQLDRMTTARAGVIALTVAQSAAMEYYEKLVDSLYARTTDIVDRLEHAGSVPMRMKPLHRFIGHAIGTRAEVVSILHLLDKPEATWEDPAMDEIYDDLRAEFDLTDRYAALESKLSVVQEALELVLDVARDRRLVVLESSIVLLIVLEIVLGIARVVG